MSSIVFGITATFACAAFLHEFEWFQKGFRWLHASGTTIGGYAIGNGTFAALRPVYPGGSNVFERVGHHVLPLARGQRRARNNRRFKVAANCGLRPDKPDGRPASGQ